MQSAAQLPIMAGELPLALRRSIRRRPSPGADVAPWTQRKSSRASVVRKPATTRTTAAKKAGKAARTKTKASASETAAARAAPAAADDTAIDDSITLVDDDSITALDFDIPISPRRPSSGVGKRKRRPSFTPPVKNQPAIKKARRQAGSNSNKNSSSNNKDDGDNDNTNDNSSVVHILPLRTQILDPHTKRRIRRNGLSAEMNEAYEEKRARRERTLAELRRARDDLRARDAEIERLRELTALFDSSRQDEDGDEGEEASRVEELERELERLREQVMGRRRGGDDHDDHDDIQLSSSPPDVRGGEEDDDDNGWGVMGGGMSDGGSDAGGDLGHDFDDEFGESSVAELESGGTPAQHRHHRQQQHSKGMRPAALRLHGPALTPPSTSPTKLPSSPVREVHSSHSSAAAEAKTSSACDAGVQAATVSTDAASQACIPDPGTGALHDELSTLRAEVASLSDTLQERDSLRARVGEKLARHQLRPTVPPSAQDDTASDQDVELQLDIVLQDLADKTARLADLSSVLLPTTTDDSVMTTTADKKEATAELASALQSVRQALADIDPDTPLPPAAAPTIALAADRLRELGEALESRTAELSDRDAALAAKDEELTAANAAGSDKDARVTNLERDVENLGHTVTSLRDSLADLQADLDGARDSALQQGAAAAEAESRLADALADLASLTQKLSERETALRGREGEVDTLRAALAEARRTVAGLRDAAARDKGAASDAVRAMRAQMIAALKVGEGFLGEQGVAKEEEVVGVAAVARSRSDDSGLGLEGEQARLA